MKIAVAAESDAGEPQAATPDTIRKMLALGVDVAVEPGEAVRLRLGHPNVTPGVRYPQSA